MKKPDVLRVCFFAVQDVPMPAVGRQEKDRLRVVRLLEGEEAEQLYQDLTRGGGIHHAAENKTPPTSTDGRGNPEL